MMKGKGWGTAVFVVSLLTTIQTFFVNTMGFLDAATGSAFGCGHEWLHCNGRVIPIIHSTQTFIEFYHRVGVPILTVLLLVTIISANILYRRWLEVPLFSALSIFFVLVEAFLGAMAVVHNEPPAVIATHFGVSLLAFSSSLLLTIYIRQAEKARIEWRSTGSLRPLRARVSSRSYKLSVWLLIPYIYIAMYVGAYISSSGVGDSFKGWPIPTESASLPHHVLLLDWTHRSLALILIVWLITVMVGTRRYRNENHAVYRSSVWTVVFVILQAFSGLYLILDHASIPAFLIHVSLVTGLFGTLCVLAIHMLPPMQPKTRKRPDEIGTASRKGSRV